MKNLLLIAFGVVIGFAVAHQVNRTPQGRAFFAEVDGRAREFGSAVLDGYREREAELRAALAEAEATAADLSARVRRLTPLPTGLLRCRPLTSSAAG